MKKALIHSLLIAASFMFGLFMAHSAGAVIPAPADKQSWSFDPVETPVPGDVASEAKPVGVGSVASGGDTLSIRIGLNRSSAPVDVFGAYVDSHNPGNVRVLNPDASYTSIALSAIEDALLTGTPPSGTSPWKRDTLGPTDEVLLNIPVSSLPPGRYTVFLMVTPAGSLDSYYLWSTFFEIPALPASLTFNLYPDPLPPGTQGTSYSVNVSLSASGGTPPYTYSCSGSGVAGITAGISGSICMIGGRPSGTGTYTVTFGVDDATAKSARKTGAFAVSPSLAPLLSLNPDSLPAGTKGVSYSVNVSLSAIGGTPPYTYSCFGSGVAGITAGASGSICMIGGTPSGTGTYTVSFRVDDANGQSAQKPRTFTVSFPVNPGEPPNVTELEKGVSMRYIPINALETLYYRFTIPQSASGGAHGMTVSIGTNDWKTNQDMMFSLGLPYPATEDYPAGNNFIADGEVINGSKKWANISKGTSNETVYIYSSLPSGTYYIMVNNTSVQTGLFEIFYSNW